MTKKKNGETVTEIGDFNRSEKEAEATVPTIDPKKKIGSSTLKDFMAGKDMAEVQEGGSVTPVPKETTVATPNPTSANPASTKSREDELVKALKEIEEAPEFTYEQKLEKHGLEKEQAMEILDSMFSRGFFEKTFKVAGAAQVTFRTRLSEDQDRLLQRIEAEAPQFPASVSNLVSKYNLAASLREFKGTNFVKADFKQKYDFVSNLPDIVLRILCVKLARFDEMMLDVMDEGAIANF